MVSSSKYVVLLVVLLAVSATANLSPNYSPNFGEICNEVNCGKGKCEASLGSQFGFKCKCDSGWSRTRPNQDEDLDFLPCIIPNCSLDYSCMPAAPPAPSVPNNQSVFDPCYYAYCGQGTCSKNLTYGQTCNCNPGFSNLLNITAFPCFSECALGSDCERLGINVSRSTSDDNNKDNNQATSFLPGNFHWIGIMLITALLAVRN
ncbi:Vitamin K-dependent protein S-like [Heracleum sosnowskyi]|uniref:Vitamin K-dependent protein S-like n=1 Tax=Heracleum sosnowskyi TaxID=360622 RepID=A0AAD8HXH2_9APIA|nr:Vitamin K-dependent protein S-like [Heracleum sosnowskyi]